MSFFKSKGIILNIKKMQENNNLFTIFSDEYGLIRCNRKHSKTQKAVDIGNIINFEIATKHHRDIHSIKSISITHCLDTQKYDFSTMMAYLELLAIIQKFSPSGSPIVQVYSCCAYLLEYPLITPEKILLTKLKLLHIFGELSDIHTNQTTQKILGFIIKHPIKQVLCLKDIPSDSYIELEEITKK